MPRSRSRKAPLAVRRPEQFRPQLARSVVSMSVSEGLLGADLHFVEISTTGQDHRSRRPAAGTRFGIAAPKTGCQHVRASQPLSSPRRASVYAERLHPRRPSWARRPNSRRSGSVIEQGVDVAGCDDHRCSVRLLEPEAILAIELVRRHADRAGELCTPEDSALDCDSNVARRAERRRARGDVEEGARSSDSPSTRRVLTNTAKILTRHRLVVRYMRGRMATASGRSGAARHASAWAGAHPLNFLNLVARGTATTPRGPVPPADHRPPLERRGRRAAPTDA